MGPAYSLKNETDIMHEIELSGPVQATMRVYRDFFSYSGGIYRHSAASRDDEYGFHSVKIVGWGEEYQNYGQVVKYWVKILNNIILENLYLLKIKIKILSDFLFL